MSYLGQSQYREIREILPMLPARLKTAFALACAERVLPILEKFAPAAPAKESIDLGWCYATGEAANDDPVRAMLDRFDEFLDEMRDRGDTDFVMTAADAVYHALHSALVDQDYPAAVEACDSAATAASVGDRVNQEAYIEEELTWQLQALKLAAARGDDVAARDMFVSVAVEPSWLDAMRNR